MSNTATPCKTGPPQIVKLDKALKLAEQWVNNMSKPSQNEPLEVEQGRPSRLGLGARVPRLSNCKLGVSDDPIGRKLHYKLDARRRKVAKIMEESNPSADDPDDGEHNEEESRTSAFTKKRAIPPNTYLHSNKKPK